MIEKNKNIYMRILVTGAAGYIGSILIPKLINQNHEITAIDRFLVIRCQRIKTLPKLKLM